MQWLRYQVPNVAGQCAGSAKCVRIIMRIILSCGQQMRSKMSTILILVGGAGPCAMKTMTDFRMCDCKNNDTFAGISPLLRIDFLLLQYRNLNEHCIHYNYDTRISIVLAPLRG